MYSRSRYSCLGFAINKFVHTLESAQQNEECNLQKFFHSDIQFWTILLLPLWAPKREFSNSADFREWCSSMCRNPRLQAICSWLFIVRRGLYVIRMNPERYNIIVKSILSTLVSSIFYLNVWNVTLIFIIKSTVDKNYRFHFHFNFVW